ncbi:hypothetical protein O3M35_009294 [Rhynocoris fuscipes]|uniref:Uncharacterized protein n=1 Tax=Rhynocoris fuscipes TaxID=488301 RepID=A0AAW1D387_9HEMI
MQRFAFGTTWRCADYNQNFKYSDITFSAYGTTWQCQIISKFKINRRNNVTNRTAQSCEFCVHHISRTALDSLIFFF